MVDELIKKGEEMKPMKFKIQSRAHSDAIQERLFELGYAWKRGDRAVILTHEPFLLVSEKGIISYCTTEAYFENNRSDLTTLDDLYKNEKIRYIGE